MKDFKSGWLSHPVDLSLDDEVSVSMFIWKKAAKNVSFLDLFNAPFLLSFFLSFFSLYENDDDTFASFHTTTYRHIWHLDKFISFYSIIVLSIENEVHFIYAEYCYWLVAIIIKGLQIWNTSHSSFLYSGFDGTW